MIPLYSINWRWLGMTLLSRKGLLAIAAVIDVALYDRGRPVSAKALAVPASAAGPAPGAGAAGAGSRRAFSRASAGRAAATSWRASEKKSPPTTSSARPAPSRIGDDPGRSGSKLVNDVVRPAVAQAEQAFSAALGRINIDDLCASAPSRSAIVPEIPDRPALCSATHRPAIAPTFPVWTLSARVRFWVKSRMIRGR